MESQGTVNDHNNIKKEEQSRTTTFTDFKV